MTDPVTTEGLEIQDDVRESDDSVPAYSGPKLVDQKPVALGSGRPDTVDPLDFPPVQRAVQELAELDAEVRTPARPIREGDRTREVLGRDALVRRLLAGADVLAAALALNVAILSGGASPTLAVVVAILMVVPIGKILGLYDRDEHVLHKTTLDEAPTLLQVAMIHAVSAWLLDGVLASGALGKPQVVLAWLLLFVSMGTFRTIARRIGLTAAPAERLLVLGSSDEADRMREKLATLKPLKAEVVGRVPVARERRAERGEDVLGIMEDLDYVLAVNRVDRVVICPHGGDSHAMLDTIRLVKGLGVKVSLMPRLFEVVGTSVEFDQLGGLTLLGLRRYDLSKSSAMLKRVFDVVGASTVLVVLAPLFATIAVAIKLTSHGPVFFRQRRIGRGGEAFAMFKFRTMYDGADRQKAELRHRNEADGFFKITDDPRVTSVGRWLRKASLDELPQLLNVLRGEMSLVGPRPLVDEEDSRIEGWFRRRLDITPGMTGAWQVLGSSRIPMRDMVTIDYLYRTNWSLWLDLKILLRTVPHVLLRRGC
ncbi:MAG TPA: exopolysaccharide biosynthesis polyprenyl glycosylphosphotransferase [Thermoleophilaceae bacterium]